MSARIVRTSPIEITADAVLGRRTLTVTVATRIDAAVSATHWTVKRLVGLRRLAADRTAPTTLTPIR